VNQAILGRAQKSPRLDLLVVGSVAAGLIGYSQWRDSDAQRLQRLVSTEDPHQRAGRPGIPGGSATPGGGLMMAFEPSAGGWLRNTTIVPDVPRWDSATSRASPGKSSSRSRLRYTEAWHSRCHRLITSSAIACPSSRYSWIAVMSAGG
jgi:hypothetical protein